MLLLKILGGVAALGLGIWLGLPGRYDQSQRDIERAMDEGGGKSKKVKRHFTPLAYFQRKAERSNRRGSRRRFRTSAPDRKD